MKKKIWLGIILIIVIFSTLTISVAGFWNPFNQGYYQENVYIQNKITESYSSLVSDAVNNWSGISLYRSVIVNTQSSSRITTKAYGSSPYDIYGEGLYDTIYGEYKPLSTIDRCICHTTWYFDIYLNSSVMDGSTDNVRISTIVHELGHALGLGHFLDNNEYSTYIMSQARTRENTVKPNSTEIDKIIYEWHW